MPDRQPARVLIVSEEETERHELRDALVSEGYQTAGFSSGRAALEALRQEKFDVVLADLTLPDIDGGDFFRAALAMDAELAGVIITGPATLADAARQMIGTSADCMVKPIQVSMVLAVVSRALMIRRLRCEHVVLEQRERTHAAELAEANKDLQTFAYSVAHDLRAPLRAVSGFSSIVVSDFAEQMPAEARTLLGHVTRNAARMERMLEGVGLFSRVAHQPLSKRAVDVTVLVREILDEMRQRCPERTIELRVAELPVGAADPVLLRQLLVNLLSNAFKFTQGTASAVIEVGGERSAQLDEYFVRDNGVGFDMQYAARLFGAFQRLHRDDEFEGTGVGLAIVQRIIHRHGGTVWTQAAVGRGAAFHFTLPIGNNGG